VITLQVSTPTGRFVRIHARKDVRQKRGKKGVIYRREKKTNKWTNITQLFIIFYIISKINLNHQFTLANTLLS